MESRIFRILAIDGGGIRGVFPAHLLSCIEKRLGIDILKNVDMVAGTSTGDYCCRYRLRQVTRKN